MSKLHQVINGDLEIVAGLDTSLYGFGDLIVTRNTSIGGNLVVDGNLDVNGVTTTVDTNVLTIDDNIILLNSGPSVTGTDAGVMNQRFQQNNNDGTGDVVTDPADEADTAVAATNGPATITLGTSASSTINYYNGWWIKITNDSPVGAKDQVREITTYGGVAEISTVDTTHPIGGSYFNLFSATDATTYYVWMDTNGDGTTLDPAPGGTGVQADISSAASYADVAIAIETAVDALGDFTATRSGNVVTITTAANGITTDTSDGTTATNFTFATTQDGTAGLPEISTVDTTSPSGGSYFNLLSGGDAVTYYVWMDTNGDGTTLDPAPGGTGIQVDISALSLPSAAEVAEAIKDAVDANGDFSATRSGNVVTITTRAAGVTTDISDGATATNFAFATTQQGTATGTKIAYVSDSWVDVPDATSTYALYGCPRSAAFFDESANEFAVAHTASRHDDKVLTITKYADLHVNNLIVEGDIQGLEEATEVVTIESNDMVAVDIVNTAIRGSYMILEKSDEIDGAAATFMASSNEVGGAGSIVRLTNSAGSRGEEIMIKYDASTKVQLFHSVIRTSAPLVASLAYDVLVRDVCGTFTGSNEQVTVNDDLIDSAEINRSETRGAFFILVQSVVTDGATATFAASSNEDGAAGSVFRLTNSPGTDGEEVMIRYVASTKVEVFHSVDSGGAKGALEYKVSISNFTSSALSDHLADFSNPHRVTLQQAYDETTTQPEITLDSTRGALTIRDNSAPIAANLFEVQNNAASSTFFSVDVSGATVTGKLTVTGLIDPTGIKFDEQASDPGSTAAGEGTVWVRNDTPNVLMFTDDTGTDYVIGGGTASTSKATYTLLSLEAIATSTSYATVAYFPWKDTSYSSLSSGALIFRVVIGNRDLDIRLRDTTAGSNLVESLAIGASGWQELTIADVDLPSADAQVELQIRKTAGGGVNPSILGVNLEFDA